MDEKNSKKVIIFVVGALIACVLLIGAFVGTPERCYKKCMEANQMLYAPTPLTPEQESRAASGCAAKCKTEER